MVESLATGFQNLYNKYTRSENGPQDVGRRDVYIVPVNNNTAVDADDAQSQFLLQRYRPKARKSFVFDAKHLCQAKTLKWHMMRQSRLRTSTGQCCPVCIPVSIKYPMVVLFDFLFVSHHNITCVVRPTSIKIYLRKASFIICT